MAPSNRRIMTLQDLEGGGSSGGSEEGMMEPQFPHRASNPVAFPLPSTSSSTTTPSYCQPVKTTNYAIPLYHLQTLPMADQCRQTLERILADFGPIIQRRGFNVKSISEFCCCGDGKDNIPGTTRKRPKQGDTVWGYNQTTTWGRRRRRRGGDGGGNENVRQTSSHTIHLRLRQPRGHYQPSQLLSWEFVAGTMAHELSHCVHQNHNAAFYKLMEEILEEHATLQLEQIIASRGDRVEDHRGGGGERRPGGVGSVTASVPPHTLSTGQRLGGDATKSSRLLWHPNQGGGGGGSSGASVSQQPPLSPRARREALAQAAERRQRQMQQLRRMIEVSKEPCVIEIMDDENDNCPDWHQEQSATVTKRDKKANEPVDLTILEPMPRPTKTAKRTETIDLTSSPDNHSAPGATTRPTTADWNTVQNEEWECHQCTVLNRPVALSCEVCLKERAMTTSDASKKKKTQCTVIELE